MNYITHIKNIRGLVMKTKLYGRLYMLGMILIILFFVSIDYTRDWKEDMYEKHSSSVETVYIVEPVAKK